MSLLTRLSRKTGQFVQAKPAVLSLPRALVSISFDDVPRSALTVGARIVEEAGGRATYYVAGGLAGGRENDQLCHGSADLAKAASAGHEIASHGFRHVSFPGLDAMEVEAVLAQNDYYLMQATGGIKPLHFAYPFGECLLRDKRIVAERFLTGRGVRGGLNRGICDLVDLRANALYEPSFDERRIRRLLERAALTKSWIIFFTHDVSDEPTSYGISPEALANTLQWALEAGCEITPVKDAYTLAFAGRGT